MKTQEWVNGKTIKREMTPAEISEMEKAQSEMPEPERTQEERLEAVEQRKVELESGNEEILEALDMLLSGVTE